MKKFDIIIIAVVLTITVISGFAVKIYKSRKFESKYLQISLKGKIYKKIDLSDKNYREEIKIKTELGNNVIKIQNGGAMIEDADCPDKLCVKAGLISEVGEVVVCLPHKLVIEIKGKNKQKLDDQSY